MKGWAGSRRAQPSWTLPAGLQVPPVLRGQPHPPLCLAPPLRPPPHPHPPALACPCLAPLALSDGIISWS